MKKKLLGTAAALGAFMAPGVLLRPQPETRPGPARDLDDAVAQARMTGLQGLDLVAWCAALVHDQYTLQTRRTPLEGPATSFQRRRGSSVQYNGALAELLRRLGFDAELVFSAQVRRGDRRPPWFAMGHAWVAVTVDGRRRFVCARFGPLTREEIEGGELGVTPVSEIHHVRPLTVMDHNVLATWLNATSQWKRLLLKEPLPWWLESPF